MVRWLRGCDVNRHDFFVSGGLNLVFTFVVFSNGNVTRLVECEIIVVLFWVCAY